MYGLVVVTVELLVHRHALLLAEDAPAQVEGRLSLGAVARPADLDRHVPSA